jgi:hypothetical protein
VLCVHLILVVVVHCIYSPIVELKLLLCNVSFIVLKGGEMIPWFIMFPSGMGSSSQALVRHCLNLFVIGSSSSSSSSC